MVADIEDVLRQFGGNGYNEDMQHEAGDISER